jgi:alpha-glucosidase
MSRMRLIKRSVLLLLFVSICAARSPLSAQTVTSPDGRLILTIEGAPNSASPPSSPLTYQVSFRGKPLIERSALKLEFEGQRPLGTDVRVISSTPSSGDDSYHLVAGKASEVRTRYNALHVDLEEVGGLMRKFSVEARAYDDAVAFRYVVPQQQNMRDYRLTKEATEFRIAKDATTYSLLLPNFHSMYESEFVKLPISAFSNQGGVASKVLIGLPTLMEVPGVGWMAIAEAGLRGNTSINLTNPYSRLLGHYFDS